MLNLNLVEDEGNNNCEYIEKEVDMGFHKDFFTEDEEGYKNILNAGCQRISHCSCNCNRCALIV